MGTRLHDALPLVRYLAYLICFLRIKELVLAGAVCGVETSTLLQSRVAQ